MPPTTTRSTESIARDELLSAIVEIRTKDEAARFMGDLCTPGEMKAFTERWRVARLLDAGGKTYRQIAEETGASTATVTRVARFLMQEDNEGYRLILDRLARTGKQS
ncbi:YerC/YecD family TrpR-related protein [Hyphobacterium sp. HN65]|uniref:YerC/YecD family TrpR-related protein n=1 Tax=Hyphobacterium lacteum TaxID=3116575 RepID=A0ABU7LSD6_9PROT|nr:YerC/YecD family TrpR-related protein [Hyphobacterium sp. HN65]MEE2526819.1 YerC/YecD family TrpR-related protein [Hyphobacterium sp. HN65]